MFTYLIVCVLFTTLQYCESANILYVVSYTSKSYHIMQRPIAFELARRGHNVTIVTCFKEINTPPNVTQVLYEPAMWYSRGNNSIFETITLRDKTFFAVDFFVENFMKNTEAIFNSSAFKELLKNDNHFDVVITTTIGQDSVTMLAHKYSCPLIMVTTFGNMMRQNILMRNPLQLSSVMFEFLIEDHPTSFYGRLKNLLTVMHRYIYWIYILLPFHEEMVKKHFTNLPEPVPSLYEIERNTSLLLMNRHFSLNPPAAYLPNIIEIGGIHIQETNSTLPKDLQTIMDNSKNGVVYVSFGSNINSSEMCPDRRNVFINVFSRLKQTVIWKWEGEKPRFSDNIVTRNWFPQADILAHPNTKVFVTHGGLLSTQEAIYYGVPILGIPAYGDQHKNIQLAKHAGAGEIMKYADINEKELGDVLIKILDNDSYRTNAKELSTRFKDRPMSSMDTAIYWIEYVIRYKGADFMRSAAKDLSWIAYNMLDVYVFLYIIAFAIILSVIKILLFFKNFAVNMFKTQRLGNKKRQ